VAPMSQLRTNAEVMGGGALSQVHFSFAAQAF
jgi:hypothetical protein